MCIRINIITNLRYQTSDVNGVRRGKLEALLIHFFCQFLVGENLLHTGLGIVKVAVNAYYEGIGTLLGHHLLLLNRADTVLRVKYDDPGTLDIGKACQSCLTGITGSSSQDHDLILDIILTGGSDHQVR